MRKMRHHKVKYFSSLFRKTSFDSHSLVSQGWRGPISHSKKRSGARDKVSFMAMGQVSLMAVYHPQTFGKVGNLILPQKEKSGSFQQKASYHILAHLESDEKWGLL